MPLPTEVVPVVTPVEPAPVSQNNDYQENVVDTDITPISELTTYVSGFSWTVDYYSQILGVGQVGVGQDMSGNLVSQQYTNVLGLELRVQSPLDASHDAATGQFTTTGTAYLYAGAIPNTGDMFTAMIGDGRTGVLELTAIVPLSMLKGTVYEISYTLVEYATAVRLADLAAKTVNTFIFVKDRIAEGSNGLLSNEQYDVSISSKELAEAAMDSYHAEFYDVDQRTYLIGDVPVYDHNVVKFINKITPDRNVATARHLLSSTEVRGYDTIYDNILTCTVNPGTLRSRLRTVAASSFSNYPSLGSIAYSKASLVVYPYDMSPMSDSGIDYPVETPNVNVPDVTLPTVQSVDFDDYYVVSRNYYDGSAPMSTFEGLLRSFVSGDAVPYSTVSSIYLDSVNWEPKDRFYIVPILIAMLNTLCKEI